MRSKLPGDVFPTPLDKFEKIKVSLPTSEGLNSRPSRNSVFCFS